MEVRGACAADPFDEVMMAARVADVHAPITFVQLVEKMSQKLALDVPVPASRLVDGFLEGTRIGASPVAHGAALPHILLEELNRSHVVLVRARHGVLVEGAVDQEVLQDLAEPIRAVFFLVSPKTDPGRHLRLLARLAGRITQENFMAEWLSATTDQQLKEALFRDERIFAIKLHAERPGSDMIGLRLSEVPFPEGTLIAMIWRSDELIIPKGDTALLEGDRLTVIGRPEGISALRQRYGGVMTELEE